MKTLLSIMLICLMVAPVFGADNSPRLRFESEGYSIAPLVGGYQKDNYQNIRVRDGVFPPSVGVTIETFSGGMDEYIAISKRAFKKHGINILSENRESKTVYKTEYTGVLEGIYGHFYLKCVQDGEKFYLVIATAKQDQWARYGSYLKACVNSFELLENKWFGLW